MLLTPVFIQGSIYAGICTLTEAATIFVMYAIFFGLVTRKLKKQNLLTTLRGSTRSAIMIQMIIAGAIVWFRGDHPTDTL